MKTLFVGQRLIKLNSIDSTNSYASELIRKEDVKDGTLVCTFNQTKGRGQRGNSWLGEANKNAALSYILHPTFLAVNKQFLLTKTVSLAVADLMAVMLSEAKEPVEIKIKWPNDIYVNGKKIAGILIENSLSKNTIKTSVIGIGININQENFPEGIKATSLKLLTHKEQNLMNCIERLCEFIEARYLQLKSESKLINEAYLNRLYQLNEWKSYLENDKIIEGYITGITELGKLKMQLRSNETKEFDLKEIGFL